MGVVLVVLGLVACVQGAAWIAVDEGRRARWGVFLAPAGMLAFALGLLLLMVPEFFADRVGFDGW